MSDWNEIIHDKENKQFILPLEKNLRAKVEYSIGSNDELQLVYSEVPFEFRGKGVGKVLVLKTFEKLTEEGFKAKAVCSYIRAVATRDPKWSLIIK